MPVTPPFPKRVSWFTAAAVATGVLLSGIFSILLIWIRSDLRNEIHLMIIGRDAAVLYPMALQQLSESESNGPVGSAFSSLLKSAKQKGMLAVAVFDKDGNTIDSVPANQLFVELPTDDFLKLQSGAPISRYTPSFPLDQYFTGVADELKRTPVLEVILPLPGKDGSAPMGFVRYTMDARPLSNELSLIDSRINRQTTVTLVVGILLISTVVSGAGFAIRRAQRLVDERNERLTRANFELTLAAKASAVGQITSHLIHGLQGSVEGLRVVVAGGMSDPSIPAWESAADYTQRLQTMIRETVALLGDAGANTTYELAGREVAAIIRQRNAVAAAEKGVNLDVSDGFDGMIDSHRASILCLIASNLVQNAVAATPAGKGVSVGLVNAGWAVVLTVSDEGTGIPESVQRHLFKPGRSGRPGGSGLGLAISQLLARQIDAELVLLSTGPNGTVFRVTLRSAG